MIYLVLKSICDSLTTVANKPHSALIFRGLSVVFLLLFNLILSGQTNFKTKLIVVDSTEIKIDSLSIIPESVKIFSKDGNLITKKNYTINAARATISFSDEIIRKKDSIRIEYRVFPLNFSEEHYHKKYRKTVLTKDSVEYYYRPQTKNKNDILDIGDFQKSCSISRAISAGNSQNLSVASDMNLQLSGMISPSLRLTASITDNNIPIQPDGNTQELQDFDKVFIRLDHEKGSLTAGDFVLKRPDSYFLNYNKKSQGAMAVANFKTVKNNARIKAYAAAALSRGNYNRYKFRGIEGNQGPYKLQGANFERYIVILSGTEKVYMDGKLLKRGESNDYVINYNTAEITFMPRIIVTKDKRFEVEFEYSVQFYTRALMAGGISYSGDKFDVSTNIYSEGDLKNQPVDKPLTEKEKNLLSSVGDNIDKALISSVDSTAFRPGRPMYKMIDSLGYDSVFVYSTNPDSAFYQIAFSYVGPGKGDYVTQKTAANGRVFRWVAPHNGVHQGEYIPMRLLVSPKKHQMITTSLGYRMSKNTTVKAEVAVSDKDINTFSSLDAGDNTGVAAKLGIDNISMIGKGNRAWVLKSQTDLEFIQQNFSPVERFRPVEFNRDWNGLPTAVKADEYLGSAALSLKNNKSIFLGYSFEAYYKGKEYKGIKNTLSGSVNKAGWTFKGNIDNTNTFQKLTNTSFLKHNAQIEKNAGIFKLGVRENAEKNVFSIKNGSAFLPGSFSFNEYGAFFTTADTAKNILKAEYKHRIDRQSDSTALRTTTIADEFIAEAGLFKNPSNSLRIVGSYRLLKIKDTTLTQNAPDESLRGRIEHRLKIYKGALRANTFYETNSGLEFKKEYSYIEVAQGQGVFSWTDYNGNGIKELDEFEVAAFQDEANYIRIIIPSTEYIKTYGCRFSSSITLTPMLIWGKHKTGILKFLSLFSDNLSYRSRIKTGNKNLSVALNPFNTKVDDPQSVYINSFFKNTLFFNRNNPVFGMDWTFIRNRNKSLMLNGYESRYLNSNKLRLRWNITRSYLLETESAGGNKAAFSEFFDTRNYNIFFTRIKTSLSYQPGRTFRTTISYEYKEKRNDYPSIFSQRAFNNSVSIAGKLNRPTKGNLTAVFSLIDWKYSGQDGNSLAFEMLEGYKSGMNLQWNLSYNRTLMNNLQLTIVYNARKSVTGKAVHTGTIQLRAFF